MENTAFSRPAPHVPQGNYTPPASYTPPAYRPQSNFAPQSGQTQGNINGSNSIKGQSNQPQNSYSQQASYTAQNAYTPQRQPAQNPSLTPNQLPVQKQVPAQNSTQVQQSFVVGGYTPRPRVAPDPEALAAAFSYDNYQVIRREYYSHRYEPTLTIRDKSVIFNNSCIRKLEDVVYIQFLINPYERRLVVRPCDEGARDAVRWCIAKNDTRKSRQISCERFTSKLYTMMGWENMYRYKLQGTRINYQGEQIYLFDLTNVEPVTPSIIGPDGKRHPGKAVEPAEWSNSFGLTVEEHKAATLVDLSQGYTLLESGEIELDASADQTIITDMVDAEQSAPDQITVAAQNAAEQSMPDQSGDLAQAMQPDHATLPNQQMEISTVNVQ